MIDCRDTGAARRTQKTRISATSSIGHIDRADTLAATKAESAEMIASLPTPIELDSFRSGAQEKTRVTRSPDVRRLICSNTAAYGPRRSICSHRHHQVPLFAFYCVSSVLFIPQPAFYRSPPCATSRPRSMYTPGTGS